MSKQTEQQKKMEDYRLQVQEQELVARANKSEYETMDYYIKARKIQDEYFTLIHKEREEQQKQHEDMQRQIQEQVDAQNGNTSQGEVSQMHSQRLSADEV